MKPRQRMNDSISEDSRYNPDHEPLVSNDIDLDDDTHRDMKPRRAWRYKFGLIEMVQLTYFVSGLTAIPIIEQYLYSRFLGNDKNVSSFSLHQQSLNCLNQSHKDNRKQIEVHAQQETSKWIMLVMLFSVIPAIFTTYFWGVYSDMRGRRHPMICASIGSFIKFIILLLVIYWKLSLPFMLFATFLDGCTGFFGTMLMSIYSFIADVTKSGRARSRRLLALEVFNGIFVAAAQLGVGFFIRSYHYFYPMLTVTCLQFVNVVIVVFIVPESRTSPPQMLPIMQLNSLKKTILVFTKRTSDPYRRISLFIGILATILLDPALMTKRSVELLYVLRSPLCWDSVKIGAFTSCSIIIQMIFILVSLRLLQGFFKDINIAIFGVISCTANVMFEAFSTTDAMMYIAAALGLLSFVSPPLIKGFMSAKLTSTEQGSLFSGLVSIQLIFQGLGTLILNAIYIRSVEFMPGLVFMVIAACSTTSALLLLFLSRVTNVKTSQDIVHIQD